MVIVIFDEVIKEMSEFLGVSEDKLNEMRLLDFIEFFNDYQALKYSEELKRALTSLEENPLDRIE